ncbi:hypothetical protein BGW37DRAFT_470544 [Umbelopsis sp. PMI_123]|nr:hypothetical protein BGW37DRAFT_470544 [Umbelopsis sp. PMI_123]
MTDPSHSEDSCSQRYPNHRADHSNGTITYHFNPTAKHSLVRKHVVQRIQTAKHHSHKTPSTSTLSLKTLQISSLHSGGLPSPPVDSDHDQTQDFSGNEESQQVVSPTPTPTEENQNDNQFASELVARALQKLSDSQACTKEQHLISHTGSSAIEENDSDINLPDAQHLRQKIADLTAEKHRLFQLMKSKMQEDNEQEDDLASQEERELSPVSEVTVCSAPSENEKENTRIERQIERPSYSASTSSSKTTSISSNTSSTERPPMYRSRPLSDRGYYHHQFHAPSPHHHLPPRSMYGAAPSYRVSIVFFSSRTPLFLKASYTLAHHCLSIRIVETPIFPALSLLHCDLVHMVHLRLRYIAGDRLY